jgi:NitT/TauT family transport system permease protein
VSERVGEGTGAKTEGTWWAGWGRPGRRALALVLFAVVWEVLADGNRGWRFVNPNLLPAPHEILTAAVDLAREGTLWLDVGVSLTRALQGFALAAVAGVLCGML